MLSLLFEVYYQIILKLIYVTLFGSTWLENVVAKVSGK